MSAFLVKKGQMLIELLIGLSVITTAVIAIVALMLRSVSSVRSAGEEYVATYLAAEGIELVKSIVETNFRASVSFNAGVGPDSCPIGSEMDYNDWQLDTPCPGENRPLLFDSGIGRYNYDSGGPTKFRRALNIAWDDPGNPKSIIVRSRVFWSGRSGAREVVLEDVFYNLCDVRCP